ncbi:MAG: UDP-glucose 4-epimerase GalE [Vampirovibrionales bacterium]|nr:UDP-glucose 4-epimerase GalE [Vampirovibrionales bacterium]
MPTLLVTGGAGYIGSHCVKQLLAQRDGWSVVTLDNLSTGFRRFIRGEFVEGSTADRALVLETLRRYDVKAVMHFAAFAYVGESVSDPEKYYDNNVCAALTLLSAMREAQVNEFIFSSSCATYGLPQRLPLTEDHPLAPVNPYGFTKRVVEEILSDFSRAYGLRYVSLRYFNAAGADPEGDIGEAHDPETHLIPLALQAAAGQRPALQVFGSDYPTPDGTCIRDYVHVNDISRAHLLALAYLQGGGASQVFNIGTEHGYSVREVIDCCQTVTGRRVPVVEGPRREGDPPMLVANAEKIRRELGWKPEYDSLKPTIETAWAWEQRKAAVLAT